MGRREKPVIARTKQSEALALRLRSQRQRAGLTYAELAGKTGFASTTLSRAANGTSMPSLKVVEAFMTACGAGRKEVTEARGLWKAARKANVPRTNGMPLDLITTGAELCDAMVQLRASIGNPSLRELQDRAGQHAELPRSTLNLVLRKKATPSRELLHQFIRACQVPASSTAKWISAWERVHNEHRRPTAVPDPDYWEPHRERLLGHRLRQVGSPESELEHQMARMLLTAPTGRSMEESLELLISMVRRLPEVPKSLLQRRYLASDQPVLFEARAG